MRHLIVFNENNTRRARTERLLPTYTHPVLYTRDGVLTRGSRARETREKIRRTINYNFVLIIGRTAFGTRVGVVRLYCRESTNRPANAVTNVVFDPITLPSFFTPMSRRLHRDYKQVLYYYYFFY